MITAILIFADGHREFRSIPEFVRIIEEYARIKRRLGATFEVNAVPSMECNSKYFIRQFRHEDSTFFGPPRQRTIAHLTYREIVTRDHKAMVTTGEAVKSVHPDEVIFPEDEEVMFHGIRFKPTK